jgi:hypothetical protein
MKRITDVANEIDRRSIYGTYLPGSAVTLNAPNYDIYVHKKDVTEIPLTAPAGYIQYIPLISPKEVCMVFPKDLV